LQGLKGEGWALRFCITDTLACHVLARRITFFSFEKDLASSVAVNVQAAVSRLWLVHSGVGCKPGGLLSSVFYEGPAESYLRLVGKPAADSRGVLLRGRKRLMRDISDSESEGKGTRGNRS